MLDFKTLPNFPTYPIEHRMKLSSSRRHFGELKLKESLSFCFQQKVTLFRDLLLLTAPNMAG